MPDPLYTYGPESGQAINPTNPLGHILTQIAANTAALSGGGTGGGSGSGGVVPATYNISSQGAVSVTTANTVLVGTATTPRKLDITNHGSNGVFVKRAGTAALNEGKYLAQYGVWSIDEPTTDSFSAISSSGTNSLWVEQRTAA